ncbi:hypothetical protein Ac42p206 [Acinetobacter phage Ac42]|uniref:hypothetical protein n=1 Tax=Acinetobacter phage Ac42 TaxID=762660 RepID=UPI0001EBCDF8|nr:hypothetical protein Ac42p206 [Acinetobacter phage Ac42]ADI96444.1 hypothetical protein Ac42p206 [Acinetobacter phage Ac42]
MKSFKQICEAVARSTNSEVNAIEKANIALLKAITDLHSEHPTPEVKALWEVASNELHVAITNVKKKIKK